MSKLETMYNFYMQEKNNLKEDALELLELAILKSALNKIVKDMEA
jgi:hypothetical protein